MFQRHVAAARTLMWTGLVALVGFTGCGPEGTGATPAVGQDTRAALVTLGGDTACAWGSTDCNLCVPDVPTRFRELRDRGEALGFSPGAFNLNVAYPGSNHWQGIQRLPLDHGRYFVLSKRDGRPDGNVGHLVHMATRNVEGLRFRSNRLSPAIAQPEDTAPPGDDRAVAALPVLDGYAHGGGMQAVGNIVALPMEEGPGAGRIALYDYSTTQTPSPFAFISGGTANAGTASLTKLSNGRYLLLLGQHDAKSLEVFLSTESNLRSGTNQWSRVDQWFEGELASGEWGAFQNLNLVTDCNDSQLYLVGTRLGGLRWGPVSDDYAHLYRVDFDGHLRLAHVASKHLYCSSDGARQCNLDAAGGVYVGPDRNLVLYATEHASDGPSGSVKLVEFRNIWADPACGSDIEHAWVDFYDDSDFTDRGFIFDHADRGLKNWASFHAIDAFNDKASAVRWCIPPGHRVRLYGDSNYGGSYKDLIGDGTRRQVNLNSWSFGDKVSSARWLAF
ncbi:hypothetical protein ACLESD_09980 [Pyxidicoccus sp. 3LFB2]